MPLKVAVIGAGPAGLTTLKHLLTAHEFFNIEPIEAKIFEARDAIGGTFRYRVYEDAELVSSKYLTAFSDFRLPMDAPDFITPEQYCQYLSDYCDKYDLWRHIELNTRAGRISKTSTGTQTIHLSRALDDSALANESEWSCSAVAICSGLNNDPKEPEAIIQSLIKTQSPLTLNFNAPHAYRPDLRHMHSSQFKGRNDFDKAQTVVILGVGETAMDIAHLAVTTPHVKTVVLCHKNGFFYGPKVVPNPIRFGQQLKATPIPLDTSVASLFDTAYVPPILQRGQLLWNVYDYWVKWIFWLISGTSAGLDQWVGGMDNNRQHMDSLLAVKSNRAIPYISAPYRSRSLGNRIRSFFLNVPILDTNHRYIELAPWPTHIDDMGIMHFEKTDRPESKRIESLGPIVPDLVISCTGYTRAVPRDLLGEDYPHLSEAKVRGIYRYIDDGLAYIGFIRPSIGAIPPLAELQAQLWVRDLIAYTYPRLSSTHLSRHTQHQDINNAVAAYEIDYVLHPRDGYDLFRSKHAVDHESYAYQLALDLGSAPTISHVLRTYGWKTLFTWAMGPNFNTKFRFVGPWSSPKVANEAAAVMSGELYDVVRHTGGGFFFTTFTVFPMVLFGTLSIIIHVCSWIVDTFYFWV